MDEKNLDDTSEKGKTQKILPIEEAIKIQEALKPLGYAVRGYRKKWGPTFRTVVYLEPIVLYTALSSSTKQE